MANRKPIVVVGSINIDLVAVTERIPSVGETVFGSDFQIHPGGKGANQAVAVARLGYPVQLIGRVGSDAFGSQLKSGLESAGVHTAGVATSDGPSGVAVILVSEAGDNSIVVASGANRKVTPDDLVANIEIIRNAGIVLTQLELPMNTVEHLALLCAREGVPLMLDPAPASQLPPAIFRHIAWFTPNETEAAFYLDHGESGSNLAEPPTIAESLLARGAQSVILKMGAHGVYLASQGAAGEFVPAFPVKAVDSTAAGDAFNGGFATGLMLGKTPEESARFASAVAGISVTRAGAQPSMPTMAEVQEFLSDQGQVR